MGTIGYIAPEQVNGGPADARSDIFSFGCIVYEAIARRRAFRGDTPTETLQQIAALEPPPLRNFNPVTPPELQRIVTRCLAKKPHDRYQTMKPVAAALRRLRDLLRSSAGRTIPRLVQLTFDKAIEHFPAISSDGSRPVFSREIGKVRKLFLKDVEQGAEEAITDGPHDDIQASWTPAGDAILFVRAADADTRLEPGDVFGVYITPSDIWRIDLATRKATTILRTAYNPTSSPDGKLIDLDASWRGRRRIWVAAAPGAAQALEADGARPSRRVVYSTLPQNADLWPLPLNAAPREPTGPPEAVVASTRENSRGASAADGAELAFNSDRSGAINLWLS